MLHENFVFTIWVQNVPLAWNSVTTEHGLRDPSRAYCSVISSMAEIIQKLPNFCGLLGT